MAPSKLCVVWAFLGLLAASQVASNEQDLEDINQSSFEFTIALYQALVKKNITNIFFSPLSIHVILGLVYVGAGGTTAHEMSEGLHLQQNVSSVELMFQHLLQSLHKDNANVVLEMANKLYIGKGIHVNDKFKETATNDFFAEVQGVKFASSQTKRTINGWVSKNTHHKIRNFVEGSLEPETQLLLVNAVYFKGTWAKGFEKHNTTHQPFHLTAKKSKMVEMMYVKSHFNLSTHSDIEANILELDYKGDDVSLVVILPIHVDGLSKVESKLNVDILKEIMSYSKKQHNIFLERVVEVYFPKFKLAESTPLNHVLKSLGMMQMFDKTSADFSGISNSTIHVDQVLHKAVLEVNEEGTAAAAVTSVKWSSRMAPLFHHQFVADRPFLFILKSKHLNSVLFMGRLNDPM